MQDYLGDNIIFIVGCPRSGTTWLRNLLGSDPSIHTGPESFLFARYIGSPLRSWQKDARGTRKIAMAEYMSDQEFLFALRQFMGNLLSPMIKDLGTDEIFVEKTPEHAFYMKEIYELLPKCKFIHILRDGRDVVSSLLAYSKTERGGTWAPHSARKAARMWTGYVRTVRTNSRDIPPDQFLEIRYENLFSATLDSLKTIF
jgi:LPS sulfotransferase NodH